MIFEYLATLTEETLLDSRAVVGLGERYFLTSQSVEVPGAVYTGLYLGRKTNNKFVPGVDLLRLLAAHAARSIVVDAKAEWLVVCGRDVWGPSIVEHHGTFQEGDRVLVLTREQEPIGVGRVVSTNFKKKDVAIKMQFDIGDLLRRERKRIQGRE